MVSKVNQMTITKDTIRKISNLAKISIADQEVEKLEVKRIRLSLEQNQGNRTRTADELGIGRTNLIAKLRKYNLLDFVA